MKLQNGSIGMFVKINKYFIVYSRNRRSLHKQLPLKLFVKEIDVVLTLATYGT